MKKLVIAINLIFLVFATSKGQNIIPEVVDLGLSVKWASMNVGSSSPEDVGYYLSWGEYQPKATYFKSDYKLDDQKITQDYGMRGKIVRYPNEIIQPALSPEYDAATMILGSSWRMPTEQEFKELIDKCKWSTKKIKGKKVFKIKGPNGNYIYLPTGGAKLGEQLILDSECFYWSSSPSTLHLHEAYMLRTIYSEHRMHSKDVTNGYLVRPVYCSSNIAVNSEQTTYNTKKDLQVKGISMGLQLEEFVQKLIESGMEESQPDVIEGNRKFKYLKGGYWKFLLSEFTVLGLDDLPGTACVTIKSPEAYLYVDELITELDKKYGSHKIYSSNKQIKEKEHVWLVNGGKILIDIVNDKDISIVYINSPYYQKILKEEELERLNQYNDL